MDAPEKCRWYCPTPGWLIYGSLVVEGLLWLSERYRWFWFNEKKGWTVLIGVAVVGVAMLAMLLWFIVAIVFRRRFQFSIRSLLEFTVVVALPCSWLAVEMRAASKEREAVAMFRKLGMSLDYDYQLDASCMFLPNAQPPGPPWLRCLLGDDFLEYVQMVSLDHKEVTDTEVRFLKWLTRVRYVFLNSSNVTDAGLETLSELKELHSLRLDATNVTNAGLEHLKGLNKLECLSLDVTQITDAGLEHIKGTERAP